MELERERCILLLGSGQVRLLRLTSLNKHGYTNMNLVGEMGRGFASCNCQSYPRGELEIY